MVPEANTQTTKYMPYHHKAQQYYKDTKQTL